MSLQYSLYNEESNNIDSIPKVQVNESKSTQKRNNKRNIAKIKALLQGSSQKEESLDNTLADFVPLSYPEINKKNKKKKRNEEKHDYSADDISIEKDDELETSESGNKYYKQYASSYSSMENANVVPQNSPSSYGGKDELLEKLNYMIHLLEEQNDEKTGNVTEELILYMFLGIFIIFVIDSFAKVGKYTR